MKLIYHPLSPFSRKVYILALELNLAPLIALQKVVVAPIPYPGWSDNNADVARAGNPLAKIPTLVVEIEGEGEVGIFDSKVICEYLLERAGKVGNQGEGEGGWRGRCVHAAADGMMDAEVLVIYEERIRAEKGLLFQTWIDGQREKVRRGFDFLERMAGEQVLKVRADGERVSVGEIAAAVALSFFDVRKVEWREGRARLAEWYRSWEGRESFVRAVSTREADWKRAVL